MSKGIKQKPGSSKRTATGSSTSAVQLALTKRSGTLKSSAGLLQKAVLAKRGASTTDTEELHLNGNGTHYAVSATEAVGSSGKAATISGAATSKGLKATQSSRRPQLKRPMSKKSALQKSQGKSTSGAKVLTKTSKVISSTERSSSTKSKKAAKSPSQKKPSSKLTAKSKAAPSPKKGVASHASSKKTVRTSVRGESTALTDEQLLESFRVMVKARKVDEKAIVLYKQNKCHFQIGCAGHEAVQVAAAMNMEPASDWAYPYYREMAFCMGWGMTSREMFLNILNKADDPCGGGRQMPMHYGHSALNIPSQSSPTGTQFLQAVGAAKAVTFRGLDRVVYVSAGEGTCAQGAYHEALNWAARERLPVIFLIQDNLYAISVHISEQLAGGSVAKISSGYEGLDVVEVDGLDFFASYDVCARAVDRARRGEGPTVIAAQVVRLQSHSISDNQAKYRSNEDIAADKLRDPIARFSRELVRRKIATDAELEAITREIQSEIDRDAEWAEAQRDPDPETAESGVYVNPDPSILFKEATPPSHGEDLFLVDALNAALDEEMSRNPEMVIFGQDVAHGKGGVFTVTAGLTAKHGIRRVFNSPLAEASIVGTAVGMATLGMKPVVEVQFGDYVWTAMMDIRNELALMSYRSDGLWRSPAVIRIPIGGYIHGAIYHSQNIEATFAHFPGLQVVLPSNAWDAKGLLKAAIRGNDPVLFLEHKGLYRQVYAKGPRGGVDDLIPLGKAKVVRPGTDATIVTWGAIVNRSLVAAEALRKAEGVEIEVIDLRTILPFDAETVINSVKKTGRVLIAHEDVLFMGFGAEVAAQIADAAFEYLDAPVKRLGGKFTAIPHAPALEKAVLPQTDWVESALRSLLSY